MLKLTVLMACMACTFATLPAQAQQKWSCTEADMVKMEAIGGRIANADRKALAMRHVASMREMMVKNDMAGCTALLNDKDKTQYFND